MTEFGLSPGAKANTVGHTRGNTHIHSANLKTLTHKEEFKCPLEAKAILELILKVAILNEESHLFSHNSILKSLTLLGLLLLMSWSAQELKKFIGFELDTHFT